MAKLSSFFGFFLDEKWSMSSDGAGVGKFYLTDVWTDTDAEYYQSALNSIGSGLAKALSIFVEFWIDLIPGSYPGKLIFLNGFATFLISWHTELQILDFLLDLESLGASHQLELFNLSDGELDEKGLPTSSEVLHQFYGIDIFHYAFNNEKLEIVITSIYYVFGILALNLHNLIELLVEVSVLFVDMIKFLFRDLDEYNHFAERIIQVLVLAVEFIILITELIWQILMGWQVILLYWLMERISGTQDLSGRALDLKLVTEFVNWIAQSFAKIIAGIFHHLIKAAKNQKVLNGIFTFIWDDMWTNEEDGRGWGKFALGETDDEPRPEKELHPSNIKNLDHMEGTGAIDVFEVLMVTNTYFKFRLSFLEFFAFVVFAGMEAMK